METFHEYISPVGILTLKTDGSSITGLWIKNQKYYPDNVRLNDTDNNPDIIIKSKKWLDRYFNNEAPSPYELALSPEGNEFRMTVWNILKEIPYGQCITYGDIAKQISVKTGKRMSAQAVGGAVGHNPIGIIIPCHRVIGADGSLTGYAGGLEVKRKLLTIEGFLSDQFTY